MSDAGEAAPKTSKRLATLEKLAASDKADAFTRYGLAMEYMALGRTADAERAFEALRAFDPTYVAMYYQAGTLLQGAGRPDDARTWIEQGIEQARKKGDSHALSELQGLLAGL